MEEDNDAGQEGQKDLLWHETDKKILRRGGESRCIRT